MEPTVVKTITRGVRRPDGCTLLQMGGTGAVYAFDDDPTIVAKLPFEAEGYIARLNIEKRILSRLGADRDGGHPNIVRVIRIEENDRGGRIVMERAKYGSIRKFFREEEAQQTSTAERLQWCRQVASAVAYTHEKGVIQSDLGGRNILLREDRTVCLCDFAGSGIDGSVPVVWAQSGFGHPDVKLHGTIQSELHALGSTLYEIMTLSYPHWDEERVDVERGWGEGKADQLMEEGKYPDTTGIMLGDTIAKCWRGEFMNAQSVLDSIDREVSS